MPLRPGRRPGGRRGPMSIAMLLQKARRLVAAGWVQGVEERREPLGPPAYCLVGAVKQVAEGEPLAAARLQALEILFDQLPRPDPSAEGVGTRLCAYNDHSNTTQQDI